MSHPTGRVSREEVRRVARRYGVREDVFERLIGAESNFDTDVVSPAGAIGPGQLMPATAQGLGVDPRKPLQNLEGSARYLRDNLRRFKGSYRLALAAYNAGPGAVEKHGGVPPFAETRAYVEKILGGSDLIEHPEARRAGNGPRAGAAQQRGGDDGGLGAGAGAMELLDPEADALDVVLAARAQDPAVEDAEAAAPGVKRRVGVKATGRGASKAKHVQGLGREVDQLLTRLGAPLGSGVRDRQENAAVGGAEDSDHLDEPGRWARDVKVTGRKAEAVGRRVAKFLGAEFVPGKLSESIVRHGRRSYRVELIFGTADHADHLHIGIRDIT